MPSIQVEVTCSDTTPIVSVLQGGLDFDEVTVTHQQYAVKALIPLTILITVPTAFMLNRFVLEPLVGPHAERWKKAVSRYFSPIKAFDLTIEITEENLIIDAPIESSHHVTVEIWSIVQKALDVLRRESRLSRTSRVRFVPAESGELLIFSYEQDRAERMIDIDEGTTKDIPEALVSQAAISELSPADWFAKESQRAETHRRQIGELPLRGKSKTSG